MLTLYRRHIDTCPYKDRGRQWKRCKCPVWVDGIHEGIDVRKSLKTNTWEEAEHRLRRLKQSATFSIDKPKTIDDAADAFLVYLKQNRRVSPDTIRKHRNYLEPLKRFAREHGRVYLKQLRFDDLSQFQASWVDNALSASKKLERLKGFFAYCEKKAKWITENPAAHLDAPIVRDNPTLPFTAEEMARLIQACSIYRIKHPRVPPRYEQRLLAMLLVLRYTGMRIRDAVQLSSDKVLQGSIFLYQQKTKEPVYVPIPEAVNMSLESLPGRVNDKYFFWSGKGNPKSAVGDWQRSFRRLFKLAEIPEGHPHRFRDTFAVELLLEGMPIEDVSVLLGHTSIKTTEKSYAPWVRARQIRLEAGVKKAWDADPVLKSMRGTA